MLLQQPKGSVRRECLLLNLMDEEQPKPTLTSFNFEAGFHAFPDDPREVDAAIRAGDMTWREFPYYEQRYGERGLRFTRSDSTWLTTLAALDQSHIQRQVQWLADMLSTRGMPIWLMEAHLLNLHAQLSVAVPERSDDFAKLRIAAERLRDRRIELFDEATFEELGQAFEKRVGARRSKKLGGNAGKLTVAAVIDEAAGIATAVEAFTRWMTNPELFPPQWNAEVHNTIEAARQHIAQRKGEQRGD